MKNKEIEELLNSIDEIIKEAPDEAIYGIQIKEYKQIKNHIEQLETKVKNLQNQVNTINNNNEELKRRLKIVQQKRDTHKAVRYRLQNNRDKAIKKCQDKQYQTNHEWLKRFAKEIEKILKGDNNE